MGILGLLKEGPHPFCFLSFSLLFALDHDLRTFVPEDKIICISIAETSTTCVPALTTSWSLLVALHSVSLVGFLRV